MLNNEEKKRVEEAVDHYNEVFTPENPPAIRERLYELMDNDSYNHSHVEIFLLLHFYSDYMENDFDLNHFIDVVGELADISGRREKQNA